MLVTTRKEDQKIIIGGDGELETPIEITVVRTGTGSVQIGVRADEKLSIHREEVLERIKRDRVK